MDGLQTTMLDRKLYPMKIADDTSSMTEKHQEIIEKSWQQLIADKWKNRQQMTTDGSGGS